MMRDMLTEIDHVAIAVNDLESAIAWYGDAFGATVAHRERVESDGVEEALLAVADSYVQLLTPTRDTSITSGTGWTIVPPPCKRSKMPGEG